MSSYTPYNVFVQHAFSLQASGLDKYHREKLETEETVPCNLDFLQYCVVFEEKFNKIISKNKLLINISLNICIMIHSSINKFVNRRAAFLKRST